MTIEEKQNYAKDTGCCMDSCVLTTDCLEPICAVDFPGGIKALRRYKALREQLEKGLSIPEAAIALNISKRATERMFNHSRR